MTGYQELNRASWDERAPAHAASRDYRVASFAADPAYLSEVVRFDQPRLGDLRGLRGVHLQCHLGTDTISLARLGATMTGLDFSPAALTEARRISAQAGTPVEYVESDVHAATDHLDRGTFDLVYTGIGAICWLPDINRWAQVVADLLRPGGRLFLREGHPVLWALPDPRPDGLLALDLPYFGHTEPLVWDEDGTYVETDTTFVHNTTHTWNRGLGEIVTALIDAGMAVTGLTEHDSAPWEALPGQMHRMANGEWQLTDRPERLPHTYTLRAVRTAV